MDELKKYIELNREDFMEEPPVGHKARFMKKRNQANNNNRFTVYLAAAAVLYIVFLVQFYLLKNDNSIDVVSQEGQKSQIEVTASTKDILPVEDQQKLSEYDEAEQLMDKGVPFVSLGRAQRQWSPAE